MSTYPFVSRILGPLAPVLLGLLAALSLALGGRTAREPKWVPPLADGLAPFCSRHPGTREYRGKTARFREAAAVILGSTRRDGSGCQYRVTIQIEQEGASASYELPEPQDANFALVDFSPDGSSLLLARNSERYSDFRDARITTVSLKTGQMRWQNAWDVFSWSDCDATVEPQGFLSDGRVVIMARPSIVVAHTRPNCVSSAGLYAADLLSPGVIHYPIRRASNATAE